MSVEIPLSRTKIVIPAHRPQILHRARLLVHFDELLDKKLILLTAPAGYGKTSLLVDFARQSEMPVCWLSLDPLDKDPQRFSAYLIAALAERFHNFGKRSRSVLRSVTSFEQDSERLLSSLVNELNDLVDEHFVLVMDDYHLVDSTASIRDMLSRFIILAGENCHLILASRRLPTLPDITLLVARQQVSGFDLEELAFRPDEIRALFEKDYGITLDEATIEKLAHQTEGWVTGLHLSAAEVTRGVQDPFPAEYRASWRRTARASGVDMAVYLDQQVLSQQSPAMCQFLLQTSLLDEFDAGLCHKVLGAGNWDELFNAVSRNNLFVLPVGPRGKWLRYHPLFKEFLQDRILRESPGTARPILARLAVVYEETGEWEKAHAVLREYGELEALTGLVERVGKFVLLCEHLVTLQSWLDEFPLPWLETHPGLLSLKAAFLCGLGDGRGALPLLDRALTMLRGTGDPPALAQTLVRRAAARRLVGDYAGTVEDASEALRSSATTLEQEAVRAEAERFKGIGLFRLGRVEQAFISLQASLRGYEKLGEAESIARLQMELGWACRTTGKYAPAAEYYRKALTEWKRENNQLSESLVLNNLSVLHYMNGDYETAVKTIEEGLACARQGGFRWQEAMLLASLGDILSDLDEYESAHQTYITATVLAQQVSYQFLVDYLLLAQMRLARLRGKFQEAHRFLREARPLIRAAGSNYEWGLLYLEIGCLSLAEAQPQLALPELEKALDHFQRGNQAAEIEWCHIWLAAVQCVCGQTALAYNHLQTVTAALSQAAGDPPLVHMLRHAIAWLAELQPDPQAEPLFRRVAQAQQRLPGLRKALRRKLKAAPLQASRLTILAMGKPQVRLNGKLVTLSQWQALSVRDLFFFFLLSSRPVSKDEIGETLWPEIDPDKLKLRFKNNMYRLRHALGQDVILLENALYSFNHATLDYEYDVEEFDAALTQAQATGKVEEKVAALRTATDLWRGPYLQDVDATWAWPERQRLEQAWLGALWQQAELQRQTGERESALHTCQRALDLNACLENFHCLAMQLHAERGNRLEIIRQYQACCEALQAELGILPSEETRMLYQRLMT